MPKPSILKRMFQPKTEAYVFQAAEDLEIGEEAESAEEEVLPLPEEVQELLDLPDLSDFSGFPELLDLPELTDEEEKQVEPPKEKEKTAKAPVEERPKGPIDYAKVQANAMLEEARQEAEGIKAQARQEAGEYKSRAHQEVEQELELLRRSAREDGYNRGYTEGRAEAAEVAKREREEQAKEQLQSIRRFLEDAVRERDKVLDSAQEELKDLAITVAEKVIRVSLRGSADILRRMVESATDKRKRCEWAHIYIAGCDVKGSANTIPELTSALSHISDRVRVIPMADDESGTCIIEMPSEILDASVSTQLGNIRDILSNATLDEDN